MFAGENPMDRGAWWRLVGYNPWGHKEVDTSEWAHTHTQSKEFCDENNYFVTYKVKTIFAYESSSLNSAKNLEWQEEKKYYIDGKYITLWSKYLYQNVAMLQIIFTSGVPAFIQ